MHRESATIVVSPIGVVHSPHRAAVGTPVQPVFAEQAEGTAVLEERYESALADIEGFDKIWLVYLFDRAGPFKPTVIPYRDTRKHGLFATRSPCRPNPIGLSVVTLLGRERNVLRLQGLDILDGTPLLDVKPYVPEFDAHPSAKAGWLEDSQVERHTADGRFHER